MTVGVRKAVGGRRTQGNDSMESLVGMGIDRSRQDPS